MDVRFIGLMFIIINNIPNSCKVYSICSASIPHGQVNPLTCWPILSTDTGGCRYICDNGYEKNEDVTLLSCSITGQWVPTLVAEQSSSWTLNSLCTRLHECSSNIPHGRLYASHCYKRQSCVYYCDEGYEKNTDIESLTCSSDGDWVPSTYNPLSPVTYMPNDFCKPKSCSPSVPNGNLSTTCPGTVGSVCGYNCNAGYQKKVGVPIITCQTSTKWTEDLHALCTNDKQCPLNEIPHGDLHPACTRNPGDVCAFTCQEGYRRSTFWEFRQITCSASSAWDKDFSVLCQKIRCPTRIPNGIISSSCTRDYLSYCSDYTCDSGYRHRISAQYLFCNASGMWSYSHKPCRSEADLCPRIVENGELDWKCTREKGAMCGYSCNTGCTKNPYSSSLTCMHNGLWNKNTSLLCTDCRSKCPSSISNGYVSDMCNRKLSSRCDYYQCYYGCRVTIWSLYCNQDAHWDYEDTACDCDSQPTTPASIQCPKYIPNGHISITCDRFPDSECGFSCNHGCHSYMDTLICSRDGRWYSSDIACSGCTVFRSTTTSYELTTHDSSGVMTAIGTCIGLAVFITIFIVVCCIVRSRRNWKNRMTTMLTQGPTPISETQRPYQRTVSNSSTRADVSPNDYQTTVFRQIDHTIPTHGVFVIPSAPAEETTSRHDPPAYNTISAAKPETCEPPPSYEEVTAHPLTFNVTNAVIATENNQIPQPPYAFHI